MQFASILPSTHDFFLHSPRPLSMHMAVMWMTSVKIQMRSAVCWVYSSYLSPSLPQFQQPYMQTHITCLVLNATNSIKYLFCVGIDMDLWIIIFCLRYHVTFCPNCQTIPLKPISWNKCVTQHVFPFWIDDIEVCVCKLIEPIIKFAGNIPSFCYFISLIFFYNSD